VTGSRPETGTTGRRDVDLLDRIRDRLVDDLGFAGIARSDVAEPQRAAFDALDYVGMKAYLGSLIVVGLVSADELGEPAMAARFDRFRAVFRAAHDLGPAARGLVVENLTGRFALLAFVFGHTPPPERIAHVRTLKAGSAARLGYCLAWSLDAEAARVYKHRGFPLKMYPGRGFFERTLREAR